MLLSILLRTERAPLQGIPQAEMSIESARPRLGWAEEAALVSVRASGTVLGTFTIIFW